MTLLLAIIGHLVGDYLLQNDWMALNKKFSVAICAVHAALWTLSVGLFSGWLFLQNGKGALIGFLLFMSHLIQDHTDIVAYWMDIIGQYRFRTGPCAPWSFIVVDNVWHIVTLWAIWRFVA